MPARSGVKPGEHAADGLRRVPGGGGDIPDGEAEAGDGAQARRARHAVLGREPRAKRHYRVDDDGADVVAPQVVVDCRDKLRLQRRRARRGGRRVERGFEDLVDAGRASASSPVPSTIATNSTVNRLNRAGSMSWMNGT
jgi:hypothetical protein